MAQNIGEVIRTVVHARRRVCHSVCGTTERLRLGGRG